MKNEDGIEVYLKPRREAGDDLRYPEIMLPDRHYVHTIYKAPVWLKTCAVPVLEEQFEIVIRSSSDFDMFAADSIKVCVLYLSPSNGFQPRQGFLAGSNMVGQQNRMVHGFSDTSKEPRPLRMKAHQGELIRFGDRPVIPTSDTSVSPEKLAICFWRGNCEWHKDPESLSQEDTAKSVSFDSLPGKEGTAYWFEFHFHSTDSIIQDVKDRYPEHDNLGIGHLTDDLAEFEFLHDPEFKTAAEATRRRIREQMYREQITSLRPEKEDLGQAKPRKNPRKPTNMCPPTCDCPRRDSTKSHPKATASANEAIAKARREQTDAREDDDIAGEQDDITGKQEDIAGELEDFPDEQEDIPTVATPSIVVQENAQKPSALVAESSAKTCGQCRKIKKPPKGKKIAWREKNRKWMYVHKDAPDEDGPAEPEDDEKPLPGVTDERTNVTEETTAIPDSVETRKQRQQAAKDDVFVNEGRDVETEMKPRNTNGENRIMTPTSMDDADFAMPETSTQQAEHSISHESTDARRHDGSGEGSAGVDSADQDHGMLAEGAPVAQVSLVETATTPAPLQQPTAAGAGGKSRKRHNESEHTTPVPKKARVDIDLTIDDDDELVAVNSEYGGDIKRNGPTLVYKKHRLEQVKREKRIIALKREEEEKAAEEAELAWQIARSEGPSGTTSRIKTEPVIKIED